MVRRILISTTALVVLFISSSYATDLNHGVSGAGTSDELETSTELGNSPYLIESESADTVEKQKVKGADFIFTPSPEISHKHDPKKEFSDFGYTLPGTFEQQESYIDLDKSKMAKGFRKLSSGGLNLGFIKNDFDYVSANDIIDRTLGTGSKSVKGGSLFFRHDDFLSKSLLLNTYWSAGAGLGYNSGRAFFVDGTRSDSSFNLWEVPVDLGLGLEIPIFSTFKLAGTAGPSIMGLVQNRSDYQRGEKGKRKIQYSHGYFANAQFKINMSGLSEQTAYELFTESQITNLFLNIEARHQNYSNFQDDIEISGTSFGIGFTFEYL